AEGIFNFLVEKYDSELKRAYAESSKAYEKAKAGKKRAMRDEDFSSRLGSMKAAAEKIKEEKAALLLDKARLESEKLELSEAHATEAARLRESRNFERSLWYPEVSGTAEKERGPHPARED
ncbi:unnamed protein product, partial [Eruca vesicaria subsp. sativa]|nr:unnamed protein product [Eruca vesicaria subsp. sativa]